MGATPQSNAAPQWNAARAVTRLSSLRAPPSAPTPPAKRAIGQNDPVFQRELVPSGAKIAVTRANVAAYAAALQAVKLLRAGKEGHKGGSAQSRKQAERGVADAGEQGAQDRGQEGSKRVPVPEVPPQRRKVDDGWAAVRAAHA